MCYTYKPCIYYKWIICYISWPDPLNTKTTNTDNITSHLNFLFSSLYSSSSSTISSSSTRLSNKESTASSSDNSFSSSSSESNFSSCPSNSQMHLSMYYTNRQQNYATKVSRVRDFDESAYFTWIYEGNKKFSHLMTTCLIIGFLCCTCFPIWPNFLKVFVWYMSVSMLIFIFFLVTFRALSNGSDVTWLNFSFFLVMKQCHQKFT